MVVELSRLDRRVKVLSLADFMSAAHRRRAFKASIVAAALVASASTGSNARLEAARLGFVAPLQSAAAIIAGKTAETSAEQRMTATTAGGCSVPAVFLLVGASLGAAKARSSRLARRADAPVKVSPVMPDLDGEGGLPMYRPDADISEMCEMEPDLEECKTEKEKDKPKLPLSWENVQMVLDEVRPYLQGDGGDAKIVDLDGTIVKLELEGACSSCSASSVTLKMGIEKTIKSRIPEVTEVIAVMQDQDTLTEEGVEEVLNGIRPFLSVSGGEIKLLELPDGESSTRVVLEMTGPPLKSMAVRVEVVNRMKRKYPLVQDVDIVDPDGNPAGSA